MLFIRRGLVLLGILLSGLVLSGQVAFRAKTEPIPGPTGSGISKDEGVFRAGRQEGDSPVELEAYWAFVEETRSLVESLESTTPETARTQLNSIADEWGAMTAVSTPNGVVRLNPSIILSLLREDPPDLDALLGRLDALLAARDSWPDPVHTADSLNSLDQILSQEAFQWAEAEPSRYNDLLTRFFEWLNRVLPDSLNLGSETLGDLIAIVGGIVLAVVLFFALRDLFLDFAAESEIRERDEAQDELLTAETALERAQTLSTGGDYRMAVRYLYLSTLLIMEERGLFRYDRAKTNREYLRSLQGRPELVTILGDVVDVFDRVWYGFQPLSGSDYNQYQTRVEALRHQQ
ncbi:MAG: DUF4129 domain-containing protein [Candidatus Promineifilaceae bacterium]